MNTTTWTKLRDGSWGLRAVGALTVGDFASVQKKDGTVQRIAVGDLVWSGDGVFLYRKGPDAPPSSSKVPASRPAKPAQRRRWTPCGYPGCCPQFCDECNGEGRHGSW
jgi:hypothetical protein